MMPEPMRPQAKVPLFLLLVAALATTARVARAQPATPPADDPDEQKKTEARELAEKGDALLEQKKFVDAEVALRNAFDLVPAPTIQLRIARSLVGQRRLVEAKAEYAKLVTYDLGPTTSGPFIEAVEQGKTELAALATKIPSIRVTGAKQGSAVRIDAREATAGTAVEVNPGEHRISAEGMAPKTVTVVEGDHTDVSLTEPGVPFPYRTTAGPAIGLAAGGLFFLGVGIGLGLDAIQTHGLLEDACPNDKCSPATKPLYDRYEQVGAASTAMLVIGGLAVAGSVVVFAVGKPLGPNVSVGLSGVKFGASF